MAKRKDEQSSNGTQAITPRSEPLENIFVLDRPCSQCEGTGRIETEAWLVWRTRMTEGLINGIQLTDLIEKWGTEPENRATTCERCKGGGRMLAYCGKLLIDFLRRWRGELPNLLRDSPETPRLDALGMKLDRMESVLNSSEDKK